MHVTHLYIATGWLYLLQLHHFSFSDQLSPYLDQKTDGFVESLYRKVLEVGIYYKGPDLYTTILVWIAKVL